MTTSDLLLDLLLTALMFLGAVWFASHISLGMCRSHIKGKNVRDIEMCLDIMATLIFLVLFFSAASNLADSIKNPKPPKGPRRMVVVDIDTRPSPSMVAVINKTVEDWDSTVVYMASQGSRKLDWQPHLLNVYFGIETPRSEILPVVGDTHFQHRLSYRLSLETMPFEDRKESTIGLVILSNKNTGHWGPHTLKAPKAGYDLEDDIPKIDKLLRTKFNVPPFRHEAMLSFMMYPKEEEDRH